MSGKVGPLSSKGRKIYLEEGIEILNRNMKEKITERKKIVMKTCSSAVSVKIFVTQNKEH
jgi:hypothetical protein